MSETVGNEHYINFDEYIRQGEPQKRERAEACRVAIGLQAVDGLKTSAYLQELAHKNIEGEITIDEVVALINLYYSDKKNRLNNIVPMPETEQAPDKHRTSTGQVQDKLHTENEDISRIVKAIGHQQMAIKEIMEVFNLKGRDNFLNLYLTPAIAEGFVRMLYPDKPHHPRQKYLLTEKGVMLYNEIMKL